MKLQGDVDQSLQQRRSSWDKKIIEDYCALVLFSLVLPYESRDEILVRGIDL
jgi:hypothetical protein